MGGINLGDYVKSPGKIVTDPVNVVTHAVNDVTAAGRNLTNAITNAEKAVTNELTNALQKSYGNLARELSVVRKDFEDELHNAVKRVSDTANNSLSQITAKADAALKNLEKEASKAKDIPKAEYERLKKNIEKSAERAIEDVKRESERVITNLTAIHQKALNDLQVECDRAKNDISDAVKASVHFAESEFESIGNTLTNTERLLKQGKVLDAVWNGAIQPFKDSKGAAIKAITESELLRQAAGTAAAVYGGPAGAAAYSAWLTYETTGNLGHALKAGVIAGATAAGTKFVNGLPNDVVEEQLKKQLIQTSLNAATIAANGGSLKDIEEVYMSAAKDSIKTQPKVLLQEWVNEQFKPLVKTSMKPHFDGLEDSELLLKAKSLEKDYQNLRGQWIQIKKTAEKGILK